MYDWYQDKHFNHEGVHKTLSTLKENLLKNSMKIQQQEVKQYHILHEYFRYRDIECPNGYETAQIGKCDGVKSGCLCENGEISHSTTSFNKSSSRKCPQSNLMEDNNKLNDEYKYEYEYEYKYEYKSSSCYIYQIQNFNLRNIIHLQKEFKKGCDQYLNIQNHRINLNTLEIHNIF